jgi:hypothetical protein
MAAVVFMVREERRERFDRDGIVLFRKQYGGLVMGAIGAVAVLYQSSRTDRGTGGYFAMGIIEAVEVYALAPEYFYAKISQVMDLAPSVPVRANAPVIEASVRNAQGGLNGRRFARDVRPLPDDEMRAIIGNVIPPQPVDADLWGRKGFDEPRRRVASSAWLRNASVRQAVLVAYEGRCAISGEGLLSPDGLSNGLHVCHIVDVAFAGRDLVSNLILLSPDFHWRYDKGTIDILDDYSWVPIGPHHDTVVRDWNGARRVFVPRTVQHRLDSEFLAAHRALHLSPRPQGQVFYSRAGD